MRSLLILLFGSLFLGASYPEVTPTTIFYRSFYLEMKALEKPERVTAFAAVQNASNSATGTSISVTVSSTSANNLLVVFVQITTAQTCTSISDNQGNSYVVGSNIDNLVRTYEGYGIQQTGGVTSVTANFSGSVTGRVIVNEYSGFADGNDNTTVYDTRGTGTGNSTAIATSTFTPAASGELVVGAIYAVGGTIAAGSGYTQYGTSGTRNAMQYDLSATTSETCPATCSTGEWQIIATAFKDDPVLTVPTPALSAAGNVAKTKYKYKNNE